MFQLLRLVAQTAPTAVPLPVWTVLSESARFARFSPLHSRLRRSLRLLRSPPRHRIGTPYFPRLDWQDVAANRLPHRIAQWEAPRQWRRILPPRLPCCYSEVLEHSTLEQPWCGLGVSMDFPWSSIPQAAQQRYRYPRSPLLLKDRSQRPRPPGIHR